MHIYQMMLTCFVEQGRFAILRVMLEAGEGLCEIKGVNRRANLCSLNDIITIMRKPSCDVEV